MDDDKYKAEADVTVVDTAFAPGQIDVQRVYLVAEVLPTATRSRCWPRSCATIGRTSTTAAFS
jgi:hypothetical protein